MNRGSGPFPRESDDRAIGLLDRIAESALDDDYYLVRSEPRTRLDPVLTGVALAVFALMVTVAAVQTQVDRPATEREQQALADDVATRRATENDLRATLASLRTEVADLSASADITDPDLEALAAGTAALPVRGPGVVLRIEPIGDDGVTDSDLQVLVNGLWALGAEAVAVGDQRLGSMSSIRTAGGVVTVNYEDVAAPYVIRAIGDAGQLRTRFEESALGRVWAERGDVRFSLDDESDLRLPAVPTGRQDVANAEPAEDEQ